MTAIAAATAFAFDLEEVLAPISAEHPSGESLRYDELYDSIKELRRQDDPTLPQGVWKRELKKADWGQVAALSIEALETRTKDLQIATWLLEAWLHLHGFPGVDQGLRLVTGLCEDFWDDIHPQLDEGMEYRLAPLEWLAERLVQPLKTIPVTSPETDEAPPYAWGDWESALHLANVIKAGGVSDEEAEAQGKVTRAKFLVSVSMTPSRFYMERASELDRCLTAAGDLERFLAEKCGDESPSFADFRGTLEAIQRFVGRTLRERMEEGGEPMAEVGAAAAAAGELDEESEAVVEGGRITSRAAAYRRLNQAADYLLRTEPHSPAPYLVKRAVSWGNMSLAELLQELLEQQADLGSIYKLLGIRRTESS